MNNWIFAILMLGVAIVLSIIATFLNRFLRFLKEERKKSLCG